MDVRQRAVEGLGGLGHAGNHYARPADDCGTRLLLPRAGPECRYGCRQAATNHRLWGPVVSAQVCRLCRAPVQRNLVDLGATPLANCYVTREEAARGADRHYPLRVLVCDRCLLVQVGETVPPEAIFAADYAYFSSFSASWVAHARRYATAMIDRFHLAHLIHRIAGIR